GKLPASPGEPACLVLSGGNIDPTLLIRVIRHGLTAAGRYLLLRVALDDRPGELHRLTGVLADLGLNVVDIEHHRSGVHLAVGQGAGPLDGGEDLADPAVGVGDGSLGDLGPGPAGVHPAVGQLEADPAEPGGGVVDAAVAPVPQTDRLLHGHVVDHRVEAVV